MNIISRFTCAVLAIALCIAPTAAAHVLVKDETGTIGTILHINPDDDPIAGQVSNLFFDVQGITFDSKTQVGLAVIVDDDQPVLIPSTIEENGVRADYTFPTRGVYELVLLIADQGKTYTISYLQRVGRGLDGTEAMTTARTGAEGVFIIASSLLGLVAIIIFNRRDRIAQQSTW